MNLDDTVGACHQRACVCMCWCVAASQDPCMNPSVVLSLQQARMVVPLPSSHWGRRGNRPPPRPSGVAVRDPEPPSALTLPSLVRPACACRRHRLHRTSHSRVSLSLISFCLFDYILPHSGSSSVSPLISVFTCSQSPSLL